MQHQQPQQLDFRPSVSGQPGDRYQQRQGTGRTRSTGYGQQRIFGSDNQQVFQGNSPHHIGRMNQVGSYQGRNTSHQAGIHGQSSAMGNGRTPSNLLSFPQQQHYWLNSQLITEHRVLFKFRRFMSKHTFYIVEMWLDFFAEPTSSTNNSCFYDVIL